MIDFRAQKCSAFAMRNFFPMKGGETTNGQSRQIESRFKPHGYDSANCLAVSRNPAARVRPSCTAYSKSAFSFPFRFDAKGVTIPAIVACISSTVAIRLESARTALVKSSLVAVIDWPLLRNTSVSASPISGLPATL